MPSFWYPSIVFFFSSCCARAISPQICIRVSSQGRRLPYLLTCSLLSQIRTKARAETRGSPTDQSERGATSRPPEPSNRNLSWRGVIGPVVTDLTKWQWWTMWPELYFLTNRVSEQDRVNGKDAYFYFSFFFFPFVFYVVDMFTLDRPWSLWMEWERGGGTEKRKEHYLIVSFVFKLILETPVKQSR